MKVNELLLENVTTLKEVKSLWHLIDPKTKQPYDGIVNVTDDVDLTNARLEQLPVKFGTVGGFFSCSNNELTSLEGAPREVGAEFLCVGNKLRSLKGAPKKVGSHFYCSFNMLTSLEGIPEEIGSYLDFEGNGITSLEGIHKLVKTIGGIELSHNPIKSGGIGLLLIEGLTHIFNNNSSIIPAFEIIHKYLGQGKRGLLACQEELIENGYEEYAKL